MTTTTTTTTMTARPHKSPITCHVLDATEGKPGDGVSVRLERQQGQGQGVAFATVAEGETDSDGRATNLLSLTHVLEPGVYKMRFETGDYFDRKARPTFFPFVEIYFTVQDPPDAHYHIPLLLSNHSYTTYRGS